MGKLSYQANGDLEDATVYIFQVQDDGFVQVYP
jgi:hypothetical protein